MWSPRANFPCPIGIGHQAWAPGDLQRGVPGRGGRGQIGRAQEVADRDEQLAGREVLARGAHVQPRVAPVR